MSSFGWATTGAEVVERYADNVKGKTILVTGASANGLGATTATALARGSPSHIILQGRTLSRVQPVIDDIKKINPDIKTTFLAIDLSSIEAVRKGAAEANALIEKIDILINNAGIMAITEFTQSVDGIELQFATNHIGHFLLTNLLLHKVIKAGNGARVVNLTSDGHRLSPFRGDDYNFDDGKAYSGFAGYGQSKTANILFTRYLASHLSSKGILAYSVHPGVIFTTSLAKHLNEDDFKAVEDVAVKETGRSFRTDDIDGSDDFKGVKSAEQGVATTLYAALSPEIEGQSGSYLTDCGVVPERPYAKDVAAVEKLWKLSEQLVGEKFVL